MILEDLQKQNEELEVRKHPASTTCCGGPAVFDKIVVIHIPEAQHAFVSGNSESIGWSFTGSNSECVLCCPAEQKHSPEPGHPRGAGGHLGAPRSASPPAEPQATAGVDRPAASRAGSTHTAEPGGPQR